MASTEGNVSAFQAQPQFRREKSMKRIVLLGVIVLSLTGCGEKFRGAYLPAVRGSAYDKLEFASGDSVDITWGPAVIRATYKIDGKKFVLTANGQTAVFQIDDRGCINGGLLAGKYCKAK
jgi:hypothetical protein